MAVRANPDLIDELEQFGARDAVKCYQCGNCSAACAHSDDPYVFPRKSMRYLQMGLEKPLRSALDPWLCYYCGKCSDQCPRGAEPGETMMGIRRWLTARVRLHRNLPAALPLLEHRTCRRADCCAAHRHRLPQFRIPARRRQPVRL